jgi:uncharacterized protein YbaP (TraB family)
MIGRRHRLQLLAVFCTLAGVCLAPVAAAEPSFLWKVSRGQGSFYLAGSVHMLTPAHYPVSPALDSAFADSDLLVEELDYGEMIAPESQMQMLMRGMFPPGGSLKRTVSADTYLRVAERLKGLGLSVTQLDRFKPWFLALTLLGMEWQQAGFDQRLGLDRHFYDRAVAAGKPVQALETVDYQIARFDEMTSEEQDRMLASTLRELETQKASVADIAEAWRTGDVATIERIVLQDLKSEPRIYERLLVERNENWLPTLEQLMTRPGRALVVVGAAHLVGPDGLIEMLRARGCTVEQM